MFPVHPVLNTGVSKEPPTIDEMNFAVSQIRFRTIHHETSPAPRATNRLSVDAGPSVACILTTADTGVTTIDDVPVADGDESDSDDDYYESGVDDDESDSDEDDEERKMEPGTPNHPILLDLLALLLVTDTNSDVAATMLTMGSVPKFYYSKNRPLNEDENIYVQKILTCARDTTASAKTE